MCEEFFDDGRPCDRPDVVVAAGPISGGVYRVLCAAHALRDLGDVPGKLAALDVFVPPYAHSHALERSPK